MFNIKNHRASHAKYLESKRHLENEKFTSSNFFNETNEPLETNQKIYNLRPSKETARQKN